MTGRILVVDDVEPNRRLLQARLEAEYFEVRTAKDGQSALQIAQDEAPDLILLDVMMPGLDGFEVCRALKGDPRTRHVPVVMVTALDERDDRIAGLQAGADDFLTKPIDDVTLFARVRSLMRLKAVVDELRLRQAGAKALGSPELDVDEETAWSRARVLLVDEPGHAAQGLVEKLSAEHSPSLFSDPKAAVTAAETGSWDLAVVNLTATAFDGLRLVARLRSDELTRALPILAVVDVDDRARMVRALDVGVNDVLRRPVDSEELCARVRTQVRRKRYADYLRAALDQSVELALTDQLTGLHNRRFMTSQLEDLVEDARAKDTELAALVADIDHFKRINDAYGHDAGDIVLREFSRRLAHTVRAVDLACRYGGEEFVVIMPGANLEAAESVAERIRRAVADTAFTLPDGASIPVTVSAGIARLEADDTPERLLKRADQALYEAKSRGRNQVVTARVKRAA